MGLILQTQDTIEAWIYEKGDHLGISIGVFDRMIEKPQSIVSVECVDSTDGIINRIVINKAKAEKYGYRIVIDETE